MASRIEGKKVAILAADGFEESELFEPLKALKDAGATVEIVSTKPGSIEANVHREKGRTIPVDRTLDQARAEDYDALMIPGGVFSPDALRVEPKATDFARAFIKAGKPVGAICHGPWILINAGVVEGRTMTGFKAIQKDLQNAGAEVKDQEVVVDDGLVTSRSPADLPAFCPKLIEEIAEGIQRRADPNRPAGKDLPIAM
ncbi:MAG: type 1 glutamine amidotransferase domain-containing protein [Caulobacteraceae bacterium]